MTIGLVNMHIDRSIANLAQMKQYGGCHWLLRQPVRMNQGHSNALTKKAPKEQVHAPK